LPQTITLDLGEAYPDVGILYYVPKYQVSATPTNDGAITSFAIHLSVDGRQYVRVATGQWPNDSTMKLVTFAPASARYIRLEALAANGGYAAATEIAVGARL
jgi:hypothetical protein